MSEIKQGDAVVWAGKEWTVDAVTPDKKRPAARLVNAAGNRAHNVALSALAAVAPAGKAKR